MPKKARSKAAASPRRTRRAAAKPAPPGRRKTSSQPTPPVCLEDAEQIGAIRLALKRSRYAATVLAAARTELAATQEAASRAHPMLRMFFYGQRVAQEEARTGLDPLPLESWQAARLIDLKGGYAVPLVRLEPYEDLIVASDLDWWSETGAAEDAVMGLSGSTLWLANMTVRQKSKRTLDVGTGMGIQAMLAASHSDHVLATDINVRALAFARFNARLNGITNIEFAEGNLLEPARGSTFDLILANPPFVISPEFETYGRDNKDDGDEFVQRICKELPQHLNDGGYGQIFCDWAQIAGGPWPIRLAKWFAKSDCDAWVLRRRTYHPVEYASNYLSGPDNTELQKRHRKWAVYFAKHRIEGVGRGIITMRRVAARENWFRADALPTPVQRGTGDAIERTFELRDFLDENDDQALLDSKLTASPYLRVEPHLEQNAAGWGLRGARLLLTQGIAYSARIGPALMKVVLRCDGKRSLRDLTGGGGSAQDADANDRTENFVGAIRQLIANGLLWPDSMRRSD